MENKAKKYSIALLICIVIVPMSIGIGISMYLGIESSTIQSNTSVENKPKEEMTIEKELAKIKKELNSQSIKMTNLEEDTYTIEADCEPVGKAISSMQSALKDYEEINKNWDRIVYSHYYYWKSDYSPEKKFNLNFSCDISNLSSQEEVKEILKDCSQIIWESMNIIYGNPQINKTEEEYFENLKYNFKFKYNYIDSYGNTKYDYHTFNFTITRYSYNMINKQTFPSILELDYTKMFNLGETYSHLGTQGIRIDFNNLLTK